MHICFRLDDHPTALPLAFLMSCGLRVRSVRRRGIFSARLVGCILRFGSGDDCVVCQSGVQVGLVEKDVDGNVGIARGYAGLVLLNPLLKL